MDANIYVRFEAVGFGYPEAERPLFSNLSVDLRGGLVSLVGPNGSGKSSLLLLAAGRLVPSEGRVLLLDRDTGSLSEEERDRLASFLYQNMEFETEEGSEDLLASVYQNGFYGGKRAALQATGDLFEEVISVFELDAVRGRPLQKLAKGELQRVLMAFSVLYGSRCLFMDEPLFALEPRQKEAALAYLKAYAKAAGVPVYIAMHELELTRKYADSVLLFYSDGRIAEGEGGAVLERAALEEAYGVPYAMLRDAESLSRKALQEAAEQGL